jgi:hypothetical protein
MAGRIVENGGGVRWREVVGCRPWKCGGPKVARSIAQVGRPFQGQKPQTGVRMLVFGRVVGNGGGVQWREVVGCRLWGCGGPKVARSIARAGASHFGAKSPGSVWGTSLVVALEGDGGWCWVMHMVLQWRGRVRARLREREWGVWARRSKLCHNGTDLGGFGKQHGVVICVVTAPPAAVT